MTDLVEWVRTELARRGVAVGDDDIDAIAKIVGMNRAALAEALAKVGEEPDVAYGFIPPDLYARP